MAKKRKRRRPPPSVPNETPPAAEPEKPARHRRLPGDRPPAPWDPVPLAELAALGAIVLLLWGFARQDTKMVVVSLALGSLAGLDVSVREHFSGYRSHTVLLAGGVGVATMAVLAFIVTLWLPVAVGIALISASCAAWALVRSFQRSSGVSWKR